MRRIFRSGRYANVTATLALVVAMGGTSYAAFSLPAGSVGGAQLKKNAVTSSKVKNGSLLRKDFKSGQVPAGKTGKTGKTGSQGSQGSQGLPGPAGPSTGAAGGALTGNYPDPQIASATRGVALAGVTSTGAAVTNPPIDVWFNRLGGEPTITRTGTGSYTVTIPGISTSVATNIIASTEGPNSDLVSVTSASGNLSVHVTNTAGAPEDNFFSLMIFGASSTG
jgi:hypothetical protein